MGEIMNAKLALTVIFAAAIIAIGISVPRLPAQRYIFKDVEKKDSYINYAFSTVIYDTWTGEVRYVAEGRFQDEANAKEPTFQVVGRVLTLGQEPTALLVERYTLLSIIGVIAALGAFVILKKE